ncbi:eukaryotic translation initiation factor 3 subunit A, partial [Kappamyces sp. JEL0680]
QEHLARYVKPLHNVILTRLLQQLSQVYSSIRIESVVKLTAFPAPYNYDAHTIEKFVINGSKTGEFAIRVNQKTHSLIFDQGVLSPVGGSSRLHSLPADTMRAQLSQFSNRLQIAISMIDPAVRKENEEARIAALRTAYENIQKDRDTAFYRRLLIQRKLEKKAEEEAEEEKMRQQRLVDAQVAEQNRLAEEEKRLAAERMLQQRKEIERAEAQKLAEKIANELREKNVKIKDDEIMDTNKLIELQVQQLEKERRELAQKTKALSKRLDHTERAYRKMELPKLAEDYENQQKREREIYAEKKKAILEASRLQYEQSMANKKRVARMMDDYRSYKAVLVKERDELYAQLQAEASDKIEAEKQALIAEHERQLEEERQEAERAQVAAEKAAAAKKAKEEAEHQRREAAAEQQKKLDEQARVQRQKEQEIDEKLARSAAAKEDPKAKVYRPPAWRSKHPGGPAAPPTATRASDAPAGPRAGDSAGGGAWRARGPGNPAAFSSARPSESGDAQRPGPPKIGSG